MVPDLTSCMHRQYLLCHKTCCSKTTLHQIFGDFELVKSVDTTSALLEYPKFAFKLRHSKSCESLSICINLDLDPASYLTFAPPAWRFKSLGFSLFWLRSSPWRYGELHTFLNVLKVELSRESYDLALPSIYTKVHPETARRYAW